MFYQYSFCLKWLNTKWKLAQTISGWFGLCNLATQSRSSCIQSSKSIARFFLYTLSSKLAQSLGWLSLGSQNACSFLNLISLYQSRAFWARVLKFIFICINWNHMTICQPQWSDKYAFLIGLRLDCVFKLITATKEMRYIDWLGMEFPQTQTGNVEGLFPKETLGPLIRKGEDRCWVAKSRCPL